MTGWRRTSMRLLTEGFLLVRGIWFLGRRFECPCCSWRVRAFTMGGGSFRARVTGYCPRCNAKARHRRVWLYLQERTPLFGQPCRLLHVAPHYSLFRRLSKLPGHEYVSIDLESGPNVTITGDLTSLPFGGERFDALICVHVLEHVEDDRSAMGEMHRVLRPGGWALINVPYDRNRPTFEDARVLTPNARRAAFGEATHVRVYGTDLEDRLRAAGFEVDIDHGDSISEATKARYGLTGDEAILLCTKGKPAPW
jgi:SAM-dependent methyltransferase